MGIQVFHLLIICSELEPMLKCLAFPLVFYTLSVMFFFSHSSALRLNPADTERDDSYSKPMCSSFLDRGKREDGASSAGIW